MLLLIEVSDSTLEYDREVKSRLYARHGIAEFWIVDLPNRGIWTYRRPSDGRYADERSVTGRFFEIAELSIEVDMEGVLPAA